MLRLFNPSLMLSFLLAGTDLPPFGDNKDRVATQNRLLITGRAETEGK